MVDKERVEELIYVFSDADKRRGMTEEELSKCPTLEEIIDAMAE